MIAREQVVVLEVLVVVAACPAQGVEVMRIAPIVVVVVVGSVAGSKVRVEVVVVVERLATALDVWVAAASMSLGTLVSELQVRRIQVLIRGQSAHGDHPCHEEVLVLEVEPLSSPCRPPLARARPLQGPHRWLLRVTN